MVERSSIDPQTENSMSYLVAHNRLAVQRHEIEDSIDLEIGNSISENTVTHNAFREILCPGMIYILSVIEKN